MKEKEDLIKIRNDLKRTLEKLQKIDKKKSHKLFNILMNLDSVIIDLGEFER